jgi:alkaline phosphatase
MYGFAGLAGIADDGLPYLTMGYANGQNKFNFSLSDRPDPSNDTSADPDYQPPVPVNMTQETHGGDDVAIYAKGKTRKKTNKRKR